MSKNACKYRFVVNCDYDDPRLSSRIYPSAKEAVKAAMAKIRPLDWADSIRIEKLSAKSAKADDDGWKGERYLVPCGDTWVQDMTGIDNDG